MQSFLTYISAQDAHLEFLLCCIVAFTQLKELSASSTTARELNRERVVTNVSQWFPSSSLRLYQALGSVALESSVTCGVCLGETLVKVL